MSLAPGTKLGPYEILSPLGAGGMGEVYRARDTRLGRDVAVKVLPQHLSTNSEVRARFEREARTVSALNHPNICVLFDIGREGEIDFLVMELVEGETLAARLGKSALAAPELLRTGVQIADALSRAHRAGVIHRDLKPGNIMLTKSGAKLMDFGLARATGMQGTGSGSGATAAALTHSPTIAQPLTAEGTIIGTFQYMAPEQLEGKDADVRSDIWSLGCVLYEMATGKRAFEGRSQASLIAAILEHEPAPIAELQPMAPPSLDRLVRAMLAKDPDDRVQTAQDAKLQMEWMLGEGSSGTRTASSVAGGMAPAISTARRRARARWLWFALPVLVGIAAFFVGRKSSAPPVATPFQFERKTFREQTIFTARFMPDSKTIVYSGAVKGNQPQLFVIRPQYPEPKPIGPPGVHLLAISSQGELAVLSNARFTGHHRLFNGTLARMPLEGAAPREIMDDVREADWSPDGNQLAVIHEVGGTDQLEYPIGKVLHESAGYLSDIRVSPDGKLIAFMEHPARWDDRGSVNVVDTEGHARELSGGYWGMEGMAWAPNGRTVLFSVSVNGSDYVVRESDLQGHLLATRQNVGLVVVHDVARDGTWAVTRDDTPVRLLFRAAGSAQDVDLSWLDGGLSPILSGDGKTLFFTDQSVAAGPNYGVALRPTTGGEITRLGEGTASDLASDGKSVLVVVFSTPPRLMKYPVGAGQPVQLDRGGMENISDAHWIADGPRVLLSGNKPGEAPRCFILDPSSGQIQAVGAEGILTGTPAPDGNSFIAQSQSDWTVFPMAESGEGRKVPGMTTRDYLVRWSPDARAVHVFHRSEVPSLVERVDIQTGQRETVALLGDTNQPGLVSIISVSLADDLRTLVYGAWNYSSVLYAVGQVQ